jgi:DNA-binding response OmpR family regulator
VAEDADAIRALVERTLGSAGYRVITATNGKEAVRRFQEDPGRIDLVLLDVVMPKLGGRAAFEIMRAQKPGLRGVFLSGYSAAEISEDWLAAQGCELLAKPITPQVLLRRIRAALDRA